MVSSPESTASSDLYALSEPEDLGNLLQAGLQKQAARKEDVPLVSVHMAQDEVVDSESSDAMHGLDSENSRRSRAFTSPAAEITCSKTSGKRKRDHGLDTANTTREDLLKHTQSLRYGDRGPSENPQPFLGYLPDPVGDLSRIKRFKTDDHPERLQSAVHSFHKSFTLPDVLWQHVLCYVPPVFLGRLLRVNHAFKSFLTPGKTSGNPPYLPNSKIQPLTVEDIWIASRRRFAPGLPRPIHGFQELDMWRLLRGHTCQVCGQSKPPTPKQAGNNPLEPGYGANGVRVVWPFGVRCCVECLQNESVKERDLYLYSDFPSFLLPALSVALVSDANHYIGHKLLRTARGLSIANVAKLYSKKQIEDIKHQWEEVRNLGSGPAEEWIKGLSRKGQERLEDTFRWEQWEAKGGLKKVNTHQQSRPTMTITPSDKAAGYRSETHSDRSTPQSMIFSTIKEATHTSAAQGVVPQSAHSDSKAASLGSAALRDHQKSDTIPLGPPSQGSQVPQLYPRPIGGSHHIQDKAARRAEIERRCAALDPPLLPAVLAYMESFRAAIQITQPMTDQAWQVLQPRLLAQLPYAKNKEEERLRHSHALEVDYQARFQHEGVGKEIKDVPDREWETFQIPVRNRIGAFADDIIHSRWESSITKETAPRFAAGVLVSVRERFYAEIATGDEAAVRADQPVQIDMHTRILTLENMKWVFDTKIKPHTDHFQKELFLCNGCDGNFKLYGFEGVIQHYAAKHTTELTRDNAVVYWRSEWPKVPPFNPQPTIAKAAYYNVPTPATPIQMPSRRESNSVINSHNGDFSTAEPYSSAVPPISQYKGPQTGPHQHNPLASSIQPSPTRPFSQNTSTGFSGYPGSQNGFTGGIPPLLQQPTSQQGPMIQGYSPSYVAPQPFQAFTNGQPVAPFPTMFPGFSNNAYGNGPYPPTSVSGRLNHPKPNIPGPVSGPHQRQMDEMAKHAKEIFTGVGGVKDLPGSVRVFVVIQHTVSRYKVTFAHEPSLSMFIDGLDHNAIMRPVRSVNGLGCKLCIQRGTSAKLYTLPHLVNHFRTAHVEAPLAPGQTQIPELDWKLDMVDLPEPPIILGLMDAPGMTDAKLSLIAWAFPGVFPAPLPNLRGRLHTGALPVFRNDLDIDTNEPGQSTTNQGLNSKPHLHYPAIEQTHPKLDSGARPLSARPSSEPLEPPGEDEYDPHRPAYLGKIVKIEPTIHQTRIVNGPSVLRNGRQSPFKDFSSLPSDTEDKRLGMPTQSNVFAQGEQLAGTPPTTARERLQDSLRARSPRRALASTVMDQIESRNSSDQSKTERYRHVQEQHGVMVIGREYRPTPAVESVDTSPEHLLYSRRPTLASDADTFDRVVPELGGPPTRDVHSSDPAPFRHLNGSLSGESKAMQRPLYSKEGDGHEERYVATASEDRTGDVDYVEDDQTIFMGLGSDGRSIIQHRPRSKLQNLEYHQSASRIQIPVKSLRSDEGATVRYISRGAPSQVLIQNADKQNGSVSRGVHRRDSSFAAPRDPQYHENALLSERTSPDTTRYRPQSPVEEDRGEESHQAHAPVARKRDRTQKIVTYEYPSQTRYEYIDDRIARDEYRPRIQYIRYEDAESREPARYVLSRPFEEPEPRYLRYERAYEDTPVYQRSGSVYHPPSRPAP